MAPKLRRSRKTKALLLPLPQKQQTTNICGYVKKAKRFLNFWYNIDSNWTKSFMLLHGIHVRTGSLGSRSVVGGPLSYFVCHWRTHQQGDWLPVQLFESVQEVKVVLSSCSGPNTVQTTHVQTFIAAVEQVQCLLSRLQLNHSPYDYTGMMGVVSKYVQPPRRSLQVEAGVVVRAKGMMGNVSLLK